MAAIVRLRLVRLFAVLLRVLCLPRVGRCAFEGEGMSATGGVKLNNRRRLPPTGHNV